MFFLCFFTSFLPPLSYIMFIGLPAVVVVVVARGKRKNVIQEKGRDHVIDTRNIRRGTETEREAGVGVGAERERGIEEVSLHLWM